MATLSTVLSRQWLRVSQRRTPLATAINRTHAALLTLTGAPRFQCPICRCDIPFATFRGRQYAQCLSCGSLERHRLQWLVLAQLRRQHDLPLVSSMSMLHVAPAEFVPQFRAWFRDYHTADFSPAATLNGVPIDHPGTDLCDLSQFADASFDIVYASHVLEHIQDDMAALREVYRVLRPGGFAILPVPVFAGIPTVEYPRPAETSHWRQPGLLDYFDRHRAAFDRVRLYDSSQFPARHQLWSIEDRYHVPTPEMPFRLPVTGTRHVDVVPVCYREG